MSGTAKELRELARRLRDEARVSPAYSVAYLIVENCADHLDAVARCHEMNQMEADRRRECTSYK